jgi:hypothetical protein
VIECGTKVPGSSQATLRTLDDVTRDAARRVPRAAALTLLTAPAVLLAHLGTTGAAPPLVAVLAVAAVAFGLGATLPVRGAPALAAVIGLAQLGGHVALTLAPGGGGQGCLPAVGRGAQLGVQMTLFGAEGCPPGTYAAGGGLSAAAVAALATAAMIVVTHLVVAAAGGVLVAAAEGYAALVRALAALVRPPVLPRTPVAVRVAAPPTHAEPLRLDGTRLPVALTHRGPPRFAF